MIMSIQQKKRLRLIVPSNIDGKILKTCVRCRQHKTKCDASMTNPMPCTQCLKKNINCTLDTIHKHPRRGSDMIEKLAHEVHGLRGQLDELIERKNKMIELLISQQKTSVDHESYTPSVSEIQSCLDSPDEQMQMTQVNEEPACNKDFRISKCIGTPQVSLSYSEANECFTTYEKDFSRYLPIFPPQFFSEINLQKFNRDNELVFWCIILTSFLNKPQAQLYLNLSYHVRSLLVEKCWLNTPRSLYTLCALLILTTWPMPPKDGEKISDNISIRYTSLMKTIALQFGLHKLDFIDDFSHKTDIKISNETRLNQVIMRRIYKFININSNFWIINLGLSNNNYNGLQQDYIINRADIDISNACTEECLYTDSLLKIYSVQSKLNENLTDLINNNNPTARSIDTAMFEVILNDLYKVLSPDDLMSTSIECAKLQLYVCSFSNSNMSIFEYQKEVYKALDSCYKIVDRLTAHFGSIKNFTQLPIHYRFGIELATVTMLRIFKSPFLNSINEYQKLKEKFNLTYSLITKNNDKTWLSLNSRLPKILHKFDSLDTMEILTRFPKSFLLVNKMKNYLISSLTYELIWYVYDNGIEKENNKESKWHINWDNYGLVEGEAHSNTIIKYLASSESIFHT